MWYTLFINQTTTTETKKCQVQSMYSLLRLRLRLRHRRKRTCYALEQAGDAPKETMARDVMVGGMSKSWNQMESFQTTGDRNRLILRVEKS